MDTILKAYCGGCAHHLAPVDKDSCKLIRHGGYGCIFCPVCNEVYSEGRDGCPLHPKTRGQGLTTYYKVRELPHVHFG